MIWHELNHEEYAYVYCFKYAYLVHLGYHANTSNQLKDKLLLCFIRFR